MRFRPDNWARWLHTLCILRLCVCAARLRTRGKQKKKEEITGR